MEEDFSARKRRTGAIPGAFERQYIVPERVGRERRRWLRHSQSRWQKLHMRRHDLRVHGRWSAVHCQARRGRAGVIKGTFGRHLAVDVRMRRERARTTRSLKW